jgi:hypothetical protein
MQTMPEEDISGTKPLRNQSLYIALSQARDALQCRKGSRLRMLCSSTAFQRRR